MTNASTINDIRSLMDAGLLTINVTGQPDRDVTAAVRAVMDSNRACWQEFATLLDQRDRLVRYVQQWEYEDAFESEYASCWENHRKDYGITDEDVPVPQRDHNPFECHVLANIEKARAAR